jgi:hypothetical protein
MKRRILLLSFLVIALVFVIMLNPKTEAFDACNDCTTSYHSCMSNCQSSYSSCLLTNTQEECLQQWAGCASDCSYTYQVCLGTHCFGGTPLPQPGVGYDYYCVLLERGTRDQCIAREEVGIKAYDGCQEISDPTAHDACCNQSYIERLNANVCFCNLDPRVSTCMFTPFF